MGAAHLSRLGSFGRRPASDAGADGVTLAPGTLYAAAGALALLTLWAAGSAWYLVNHDTLAARLLAQQTEMQYAYEGRIGALRTRLDHLASQGLIASESVETRVTELSARQARVEARHLSLANLLQQAGPTPVAGLAGGEALSAPDRALSASPSLRNLGKPTPVPDALSLGLRLRDSFAAPEPAAGSGTDGSSNQSSLPVQNRLDRLQSAMALVETAQIGTLAGLIAHSERQVTHLRDLMGETGLDPSRLEPDAGPGLGGPFLSLADPAAAGFESVLDQARMTLASLDRLRRAKAALPFERPTLGEAELTSGYGVRMDPFTRGPALHTGLDFRADYGAAVRATGAGQVIAAEPAGGYGNLVEIEHAGGVTTRYAHLSSMTVVPGQRVDLGTVIGRAGSTGRSTGPHLHYETRIDGRPVDPQRFLRAGARLAEVAVR